MFTMSSTGPDGHHVSIDLRCEINDLAGWPTRTDHGRHPTRCGIAEICKDGLALGTQPVLDRGAERCRRRIQIVLRNDVKRVKARIESVGQVDGHRGCTSHAFRAVRGEDDRLEHTDPSFGRHKNAQESIFAKRKEITGMEAPAVDRIIVAVDGSDRSLVAVDHAVAVARRYGGDLVVLYVLPRAEYEAMSVGDVPADAISAATRSVLDEACSLADEAGLTVTRATAYGFSPYRKLTHPGSVLLDVADDFEADLVVVPRDPDETATLAKAAMYVLEYASQPVLAV